MPATYTITTKRFYVPNKLARLLHENYPGRGDKYYTLPVVAENLEEERGILVAKGMLQRDQRQISLADVLWFIRYAPQQEAISRMASLLGGCTISIEAHTADEEGTRQAVEAVRKLVGDRTVVDKAA